MVGKFDDEDNTLGHIAALTGNSKLFKVSIHNIGIKLYPLYVVMTINYYNDNKHMTLQVVFPLPSLKPEPASTSSGDAQPTSQFRRLISLGESAQQKIQRGQFAALMWENADEKTPLHIAIENKHTWYAQLI